MSSNVRTVTLVLSFCGIAILLPTFGRGWSWGSIPDFLGYGALAAQICVLGILGHYQQRCRGRRTICSACACVGLWCITVCNADSIVVATIHLWPRLLAMMCAVLGIERAIEIYCHWTDSYTSDAGGTVAITSVSRWSRWRSHLVGAIVVGGSSTAVGVTAVVCLWRLSPREYLRHDQAGIACSLFAMCMAIPSFCSGKSISDGHSGHPMWLGLAFYASVMYYVICAAMDGNLKLVAVDAASFVAGFVSIVYLLMRVRFAFVGLRVTAP